MKTMTCKQLGGACNQSFRADTFEEIEGLSKKHGMEMYQKSDKPHIKAMNKMKRLMIDPLALKKWLDGKQEEFNLTPKNP